MVTVNHTTPTEQFLIHHHVSAFIFLYLCSQTRANFKPGLSQVGLRDEKRWRLNVDCTSGTVTVKRTLVFSFESVLHLLSITAENQRVLMLFCLHCGPSLDTARCFYSGKRSFDFWTCTVISCMRRWACGAMDLRDCLNSSILT